MEAIKGSMSISGVTGSALTIGGSSRAEMSIGTVVARNGTNDYGELENKPSIEDVTLEGNKTLEQIGVKTMSVQEIEKLLYLD